MKTNKAKIYSGPVRSFLPVILLTIAIMTGTAYGCKETEAASPDIEEGYEIIPDLWCPMNW